MSEKEQERARVLAIIDHWKEGLDDKRERSLLDAVRFEIERGIEPTPGDIPLFFVGPAEEQEPKS